MTNTDASNQVKHLTQSEFDTFLKEAGATPVLVDFYAEWCGPCKMAAPIIEELATEMAGKVILAKVDVDAEHDLAGTYGVMSIPTMVLFEKGQEVNRQTGFAGKQGIVNLINSAK